MRELGVILVFRLDAQRFAVAHHAVERVIRAVALTHLPGAPDFVYGLMNLSGTVVPVVNMRRRTGLPDRPIRSTDSIVIVRIPERTIGLAVDTVEGLIHADAAQFVPAQDVFPHAAHVGGVLKRDDGLIILHDLARFLAADESERLDAALGGDGP